MGMNDLLLQMITARAGAGANSSAAEMLTRLNCPSADGGTPDVRQLLAQFGSNNPLLSALGNHCATMRASGTSHTGAGVIDVELESEHEVDELVETQVDAASNTASELREELQKLSAELRVLRERNDLLAATLGACCLCWGQDQECRFCRGRGRPGFMMPDEAHIGEFVLPAIQMLRAQRAKKSICSQSSKSGAPVSDSR